VVADRTDHRIQPGRKGCCRIVRIDSAGRMVVGSVDQEALADQVAVVAKQGVVVPVEELRSVDVTVPVEELQPVDVVVPEEEIQTVGVLVPAEGIQTVGVLVPAEGIQTVDVAAAEEGLVAVEAAAIVAAAEKGVPAVDEEAAAEAKVHLDLVALEHRLVVGACYVLVHYLAVVDVDRQEAGTVAVAPPYAVAVVAAPENKAVAPSQAEEALRALAPPFELVVGSTLLAALMAAAGRCH
jgi:hypothetical protein